jgi:hypothetical protein
MSGMNLTESQFRELQNNVANGGRGCKSDCNCDDFRYDSFAPRQPSGRLRKPAVQTFDGPVDLVLTLHGHCPSKKNLWSPTASGGFRLLPEVKAKIDALTTQALFAWGLRGPVEHPELTIQFYVNHKNRDRDGMFTTILDCLQAAGVLVNDNLAHNNSRTVLEPAEFVSSSEERVDIRVVKK